MPRAALPARWSARVYRSSFPCFPGTRGLASTLSFPPNRLGDNGEAHQILSISALTRSISAFNSADAQGSALSRDADETPERKHQKVTAVQIARHNVRIITTPVADAVY